MSFLFSISDTTVRFNHNCSVLYFSVKGLNFCKFCVNCYVYFEYYVCSGFLNFDTSCLLYGYQHFRETCCLCVIITVIIKKTTVEINTTCRFSIHCDILLCVNTAFSLYDAA